MPEILQELARHAARDYARSTLWDLVVDELEARLAAWRDALCGRGPFPDEFEWPVGLSPMPSRLRSRAQLVLAAQRDIEMEILARRGVLGAMLSGGAAAERQGSVPLYVDQRS